MLNNKLSIASLIMLSAWGSLYAAEPAGRVLILQGTAVAVRGTQEIPLSRGVTVESGDLLKVADGSSLQVRFTDESVVALRANSQYKIDDYKFSEKGDADKSVFSLLKGGMRTITGLIGKRNPDNYQMRSTTATIGIRGTHFTAVNCAADCLNADGSKAPDGLYGGVTDGRIVVRNGAGELEFGRDQYFQVASFNALPVPLLAPPSFLRDKLEGMAKASKGSQGKTAEAQASGGSSTSETTSPAANSFVPSLSLSTLPTTYVPTENPVVSQQNQGGTATSGTWSYAYSEASVGRSTYGGYSSVSSYTYGASNVTETLANYPMPAGFTYSPLTWYKSAFGPYTSTYTDSSGTYTTTFTKSASVDTGAYTGTDGQTAHWGRFNVSETYSSGGVTGTTDEITHWVHGAAVTALPTSGIFTFTHVGGTSPTDAAGNVGSLTSGGSWTVNFGSKTLYSASPVTWTMPNGASYQVYISPGAAATWSTYSQNYSESLGGGTYTSTETGVNTINRSGTTGGSCSGNGCTMTNVVLSPQFGGANATGLGLGIATTATTSSGTQNTAQVRVYTR